MADEGFSAGRRVIYDGYRGTVKYLGEVPTTSGQWLGVEWDDENRGKHNGTLEGVSYFVCSHPTSGSFIRPKKVEFGISVVEALRLKYSDNDKQHIQDMHVLGKGQKTEVEFVGADSIWKQQSCFERLTHVVLSNQAVNGPDEHIALASLSPNIINLDLSGNLIASWECVARIVHNLKKLKILTVSENRLTLPSDLAPLTPSFYNIKELFLNKMKMSWQEISAVMNMFPSLESLHICHNSITSLRVSNGVGQLSCYKNLKLLDFHGNELSDWNNILDLGVLPRLNTLILTSNKLTEISFGNKQASNSNNFLSLTSLILSENQIHDIASINALNSLPLLEELRFKGNPLFEGWTTFDCRQELIARIASLRVLNGSPVTEKERKAAEQAYIKKFTKDWLTAGGRAQNSDSNKLEEGFLTKHPRYLQLIKVHGSPQDTLSKTSISLKDSLISLVFKCPDDSSKNVITKKLPGTMTIGKVKGLLNRLYKVDSADQNLSYLDTKNEREIPLDDDLRQLSFYSVANGDTIFLRW